MIQHLNRCIEFYIVHTYFTYPEESLQIKRLSKDTYLDKRTNEVKSYNKIPNKDKPLYRLCSEFQAKFQNLRRIILGNFNFNSNEKHLIVTYAEVMKDYRQLGKDLKPLLDGIKYRYPNCEYVAVKELQNRLSLHCHILLKNDAPLKLSETEIQRLWEHGCIKIKPTFATLTTYFDVTRYERKVKLLPEYPDGMRLYNCSKGILRSKKHPPMTYEQAQQIITGKTLSYESEMLHNYIDETTGEVVATGRTKYEQWRPP